MPNNAYTSATRHTKLVRFLRTFIPLASIIAIIGVTAYTIIDPFNRFGNVSFGPISLDGTEVTMEKPRLSGFRKDARPYEMTAEQATQDIRKPNVVDLKNLIARFATDEKNMARLEANKGIFDTQADKLELNGNVRLRTDNGYDVKLTSAFIDMKSGRVRSREPIEVGLTNGTITSDNFDVEDNGQLITFTGRVRALFDSPTQTTK